MVFLTAEYKLILNLKELKTAQYYKIWISFATNKNICQMDD